LAWLRALGKGEAIGKAAKESSSRSKLMAVQRGRLSGIALPTAHRITTF